MKENERREEEENECPDLYGALNVENTATSIEVRIYLSSYFFFSVFAIERCASLFSSLSLLFETRAGAFLL